MDNQKLMDKKSKSFDYKWVIIGVCALVICIGLGFCSSTKGIFLPKILAGTGLERGPFGISDTFRYVTTAVVNIFFGALVIKLGVKLLMGLGFISLVASMVLYGVSTELWQFYIAGALLGLGLAWTTTTMIGYIINKWVKKNRGTVMGFILATNGLGGAIATNLFMPIMETGLTAYKTVFYIIAITVAIIGIIAVIFIKDKKLDDDEAVPAKKQKGDNWVGISSKVALKKSYFYLAMLCIFITGVVIQGITGVFNAQMEEVGISPALRQITTTVSMIILTCTKFLTGFMYDRKGLRFTMTINYICAFFAMGLMAFIGPSTIGIILCFVYLVLADIALPLETIMLPIYAGDLFGRKEYAKMLGICVSVNTAGYALGSPLMGFVFDAFGSYVPAFYAGAILMFATTVIMQFVITSADKEKKKIEEQLKLQEAI